MKKNSIYIYIYVGVCVCVCDKNLKLYRNHIENWNQHWTGANIHKSSRLSDRFRINLLNWAKFTKDFTLTNPPPSCVLWLCQWHQWRVQAPSDQAWNAEKNPSQAGIHDVVSPRKHIQKWSCLPIWKEFESGKVTVRSLPSLKLTARTWKWIGRWFISFWDGLFSGPTLVLGNSNGWKIDSQIVPYTNLRKKPIPSRLRLHETDVLKILGVEAMNLWIFEEFPSLMTFEWLVGGFNPFEKY